MFQLPCLTYSGNYDAINAGNHAGLNAGNHSDYAGPFDPGTAATGIDYFNALGTEEAGDAGSSPFAAGSNADGTAVGSTARGYDSTEIKPLRFRKAILPAIKHNLVCMNSRSLPDWCMNHFIEP